MRYTTISFPDLGIKINPGYQLDLGFVSVYYYGLLIAFGILLATVYGLRRGKQFGLSQDNILDGALAIIPFAIICARAYYCIFAWDEYKANPIEVFYIWNGGLAIYGGVIGAAIGIVVYCKIKKLSLGAALDLTSLGFLIGQSIGRWGNFFNREAHGEETTSFLRMGILDSYTGVTKYYHPTFLYESVWNLMGFILLHFLSKRRRYDGQVALGYVAWYGLGRTFIEGLRADSLYWGDLRVSQVLAAVSCLTAGIILLCQFVRSHDPANLYVNRVAAAQAAAEAEATAMEAVTEEAVEEEAATEETVDQEAVAENNEV